MRLRYILILLTLLFTLPTLAEKEPTAAELKAQGDEAMQKGRFTDALRKFTYAMEKAEDDRHDDTTYIRCVGNISIIYSMYDDTERSLHYIQKAYDYAVKTKNYTLQSRSVINMVGMYCELKDLKNAEHYFALEEELAPKDKDPIITNYYLLYNKGMIAQLRGDYRGALQQHLATLRFAQQKQMGPRYEMGQDIEMGKCYLHLGQTDKALAYTRKTLATSRFVLEDNNTRILAYRQMAEIYTQLGMTDSANYYTNLRTQNTDSVLDMKEFSKAKEVLLRYEQAQSDRRNRRQTLLIVAAIAVVTAVLMFILLRIASHRRMRRQEAEHQQEIATLEAQHQRELEAEKEKENETPAAPSERTPIGLPTRQVELLRDRIEEVMQQTSVITDSEFSLKRLTELVKSNTKYVSWVINEKFGMNFKQLLNRYRIEEAARRLQDTTGEYANYTIEAVARSVGFNSQSSFIEAFKNIKGVTPNQFKQAGA